MEKTLLETVVENNIGSLKLIYTDMDVRVKAEIVSMLKDSKELLTQYDDLKKLANDIVDIVDEKTQTGIADAVDGAVLKMVLGFIITAKAEEWWDKTRAELIAKIDTMA